MSGDPVAAYAAQPQEPARRQCLALCANPARGRDYLSVWEVHLPAFPIAATVGPLGLKCAYVPDHAILAADCRDAYLQALAAQDWASLEALAAAVQDDFNNLLVPRWLSTRCHHGDDHCVTFEDRQPLWQDRGLLQANTLALG